MITTAAANCDCCCWSYW